MLPLNPILRLSKQAAHRASRAREGPDLAPKVWLCGCPSSVPSQHGGPFTSCAKPLPRLAVTLNRK